MKIDIAKPYMNPCHRLRLPILAFAGALSLQLAHADIITLKSGERFQGPVLSEDASSLTIEYNLTPKIKDKKLINKADIKEHVRQSVAMIAMEERGLAKTLPTADLLSAAEYESIIQDKLRTFTAQFPGTPEAAEVEKIIATLGEEKSKVQNGEVKMEGRWVDSDTARRDAYNIEAYRARLAMKHAAEQNNDSRYINALRQFDTLRTQYGASLQYVAAITEVLEILEKYEKQLSGMISEQPILNKQRDDGLKLLSGSDLQLSKNAVDQEKANFKSLADSQLKNKVKWRDVYKYDLKSLQEAMSAIIKERADLRLINLPALQAENETLMTVVHALADGKATEAQSILSKLPKDQIVSKTTVVALDKQVKLAVTEERKKQVAGKGGAVAAPVADDKGDDKPATTEESNPMVEAMKKRQEEMEKKKAAADKKSKPAADKPKSDAPSAPPAPEVPETLMEKINPFIPYIGGGLLLVLVAAMLLGKKKNKE
ncbi:MAG: PTPDL family protein [Verrucomicrobium sp.]